MKRAVVKVEATQGKRLVALRRAANRAMLAGGGDLETLVEMFQIDAAQAQTALREAGGSLEQAVVALLANRTTDDGKSRRSKRARRTVVPHNVRSTSGTSGTFTREQVTANTLEKALHKKDFSQADAKKYTKLVQMVARHKLGPSGSENEVNRLALQYIHDERKFDRDYRGMTSRYTRERGEAVEWPRTGKEYQADLPTIDPEMTDDEVGTGSMVDPGTCYRRPRQRCTTNDDCTRPSLSIVARREGASRMVRTVDEGPCVFYSADRLRFRDGRGLGAVELQHLKELKRRVERGDHEDGSDEEEHETTFRYETMTLRHNRVFSKGGKMVYVGEQPLTKRVLMRMEGL